MSNGDLQAKVKRHLYVVLDDHENGYGVHKLDLSDDDDHLDGSGAQRLPEPPVFRVELMTIWMAAVSSASRSLPSSAWSSRPSESACSSQQHRRYRHHSQKPLIVRSLYTRQNRRVPNLQHQYGGCHCHASPPNMPRQRWVQSSNSHREHVVHARLCAAVF